MMVHKLCRLSRPCVLVLALSGVSLPLAAQLSALRAWQSKVDPWVLETTSSTAETEFLILLVEQADLSAAAALPTKLEKGLFVFDRLRQTAAATQGPLLQELDRLGVERRPFWVANMIWARGDLGVVETMASRPDVARIHANPWVRMELPEPVPAGEAPEAIEWNVSQIGAPDYWALGFTGQGAVIAGQDTGYDWDHPALINQYRGWNGASADHNYNWHDAIHSGGGVCGANSPEPCDDHGHGTHTMGTMVGNDLDPSDPNWPAGAPNAVGVAPGARWIGCRNMDVGNGTPATYSECFQWFIAPTDLNNQNPDPSKAPHVINNSWSCPPFEGCTDPNVLLTVVENTRAAGILVVVSAGNSGSGCETVDTPAAIYEASFTVGATDSSDNIAGFSSRGAVVVDGSNRLKPNVSAPGVSVRSATRGGGYGFSSGTSMAAPHVAAQAALLMSNAPYLVGEVGSTENCIEGTALPRTSGQSCSGTPGTEIPNNTYGWGRIELISPLPSECLLTLIFADGFESGDTSAWGGSIDP